MVPADMKPNNKEVVRLFTLFPQNAPLKFMMNQYVKIGHLKGSFTRAYDQKYSGEIFQIFRRYYRGKSRKENPQKLTQLSSRSHPRHLVGKRTAQKDTIIDITSDSQVNSNFPYRWSPASLTFNNYFYLFLYSYIT